MNKLDQERLHELKLRVWAHVASQLIDPDNDPDEKLDNYTITDHQIETNLGRRNKAIRFLLEAGIIEKISTKREGLERYKILKFKEADSISVKPEFGNYWSNCLSDVQDSMFLDIEPNDPQETLDLDINTKRETLSGIEYKSFREFNDAEKIYIYYHQDEFDVYTYDNGHYTGKIYYRKDILTFRHKMILKCLVELEIFNNFPQYVGQYAGCNEEVIQPENIEKFTFNKYAVSSVFLKDEIASILKVYEEHKNKANKMLDAFNKTNAWVESVGGFDEALRIIRKQVIEDFRSSNKRFEKNMVTFCPQSNSYSIIFKFVNKHLDIFNYETIYGDPALKGENVYPHKCGGYGDSALNSPDIKEAFDEPEDKGSDL